MSNMYVSLQTLCILVDEGIQDRMEVGSHCRIAAVCCVVTRVPRPRTYMPTYPTSLKTKVGLYS
jgi:hypothetical protein